MLLFWESEHQEKHKQISLSGSFDWKSLGERKKKKEQIDINSYLKTVSSYYPEPVDIFMMAKE